MSAPNFGKKNASKYYVIQDIPGDFNGEFVLEDVLQNLEQYKIINVYNQQEVSRDNERDYPGLKLGEYQTDKQIGKFNLSLTFEIIMRIGYYQHSNLDFECWVYASDDELHEFEEDLENYQDEMEFCEDKYNVRFPKEEIREFIARECGKLESIFEKVSIPIRQIGIFSNGEAVYERTKE